MDIKIRRSNKKDFEEFKSMKKAYLKYASELTGDNIYMTNNQIKEEFFNALKKRNIVLFILEINKEICGFMKITLFKKHKVSYLDDIFVKPEFQGKGYGKKLFEEFINYSKRNKVEKMGLGVRVENKRAISLYKKYGFKIIGYNFGKKLK